MAVDPSGIPGGYSTALVRTLYSEDLAVMKRVL
jgi:hypothetical protein